MTRTTLVLAVVACSVAAAAGGALREEPFKADKLDNLKQMAFAGADAAVEKTDAKMEEAAATEQSAAPGPVDWPPKGVGMVSFTSPCWPARRCDLEWDEECREEGLMGQAVLYQERKEPSPRHPLV